MLGVCQEYAGAAGFVRECLGRARRLSGGSLGWRLSVCCSELRGNPSIFRAYSQHISSIFPAYSLHIPYISEADSNPIPSRFSAYSQHIHRLWTCPEEASASPMAQNSTSAAFRRRKRSICVNLRQCQDPTEQHFGRVTPMIFSFSYVRQAPKTGLGKSGNALNR